MNGRSHSSESRYATRERKQQWNEKGLVLSPCSLSEPPLFVETYTIVSPRLITVMFSLAVECANPIFYLKKTAATECLASKLQIETHPASRCGRVSSKWFFANRIFLPNVCGIVERFSIFCWCWRTLSTCDHQNNYSKLFWRETNQMDHPFYARRCSPLMP